MKLRQAVYSILSVSLVLALALSDFSETTAKFWSSHAMLTNLTSSALFIIVGLSVVDLSLRRREARRIELVTRVAFNAIARAPLGQRRIMWHLVYGGELIEDVDFKLSFDVQASLKATLKRHKLEEVSESSVLRAEVIVPPLVPRLNALLADDMWVESAYNCLRNVVAGFRTIISRWSSLLVLTEATTEALNELSAQAEELTDLMVRLLPAVRQGKNGFSDDELIRIELYWRKAFTNAVMLDEALIALGGERGPKWVTPGRRLLQEADRSVAERSRAPGGTPLRLYRKSGLDEMLVES